MCSVVSLPTHYQDALMHKGSRSLRKSALRLVQSREASRGRKNIVSLRQCRCRSRRCVAVAGGPRTKTQSIFQGQSTRAYELVKRRRGEV